MASDGGRRGSKICGDGVPLVPVHVVPGFGRHAAGDQVGDPEPLAGIDEDRRLVVAEHRLVRIGKDHVFRDAEHELAGGATARARAGVPAGQVALGDDHGVVRGELALPAVVARVQFHVQVRLGIGPRDA